MDSGRVNNLYKKEVNVKKCKKVLLLKIFLFLFFISAPLGFYPVFDVLMSDGHEILRISNEWGWKFTGSAYYIANFMGVIALLPMMRIQYF